MDYREIEKLARAIQDLGVFNVRYTNNGDLIYIDTKKIVSKVNYKKLMKMNNNKYMKIINFEAPGTIENFQILEEISLKTGKFSQDALINRKQERLNKENNNYTMTKEEKYEYEIDMYGYLK